MLRRVGLDVELGRIEVERQKGRNDVRRFLRPAGMQAVGESLLPKFWEVDEVFSHRVMLG